MENQRNEEVVRQPNQTAAGRMRCQDENEDEKKKPPKEAHK